MITIFHNNRCGKSRGAVCLLEEAGKSFKVVEYLKEAPSIDELKTILKKLKLKPHDIVRTKEPIYIEKYKGKELSDQGWLQALHEHPILIERPIVINGDKAVIARPPERVNEIL